MIEVVSIQGSTVARATLTGALGRHYKYGAGVLDVQFESPDIVLSCGYDTCVRMWDLRQSYNQWSVLASQCSAIHGHYTE